MVTAARVASGCTVRGRGSQNAAMDQPTVALLSAAAAVAAAALAVLRSGIRQRRLRGWAAWSAALASGAAAIALAPWSATPGAPTLPAAAQELLLLAWPLLLLAGTRQFHARLALPGDERLDMLALAAAAAVAIVVRLLDPVPAGAPLLPGIAALLLHLYVAAMLAAGRSSDDAGALRLTGGAVGLAALAPGVAWMAGAGDPAAGGLDLRTLGAIAPLAVVGFTLLAMMNERTARELVDSRRRLQVLAYTDTLTGIANRRHFELLAARLLHAGHAPVLLLFDVDHFKTLNDRLGHAAGDRALQLVGAGLRETLRAGDIAGRLGGDEFALLLADVSLRQAVGVADRLLQRIQSHAPAQRLPRLGLSFGLVQTRAGETVDEALRRADQALYEARRQGRSCLVTAQGEEHRPVFSESQRLGLTEA